MNRKPILLFPFALLLLPLASAKPPPDLPARLAAWIQGEPGGIAVAWVDADGAAFHQSGQFAADDARPITPDTQFELGSVTKVFTALLLAESERLGQVSRNDAAVRYLLPSDDPAQAALAKITLLSLATHTSGLPRLPGNLGLNADLIRDPYAAYHRAALIEALRGHGPEADAGRTVAYSNFGAAVLGEALGAAWGTSYAEALRVHVLEPLTMKATSIGLAGAAPPDDLAPGHLAGKRVPNWTFLAFAPAGALRSSAREMAVFLGACVGGGKAPLRAAIDATLPPQRLDDDTGGRIGLGWMLAGDDERPIAWHNGATAGSHAFVGFAPKTGTAVAILANVQKGSEQLGFTLLGGKPPRPKTAVPNAVDYIGRYPLNPTFDISITQASGSLLAQATGQSQMALRPVSADRFAVIGVPAEFSFERGADGRVTALVLHQNGREQRGTRNELPPPAKEIALPEETLAEYRGDYPVRDAFVFTITVENGETFVQATGQPKIQMFASAKDEFFCKAVDAQVSFQRDVTGKITGLILHQNGRDLAAQRSVPSQ